MKIKDVADPLSAVLLISQPVWPAGYLRAYRDYYITMEHKRSFNIKGSWMVAEGRSSDCSFRYCPKQVEQSNT